MRALVLHKARDLRVEDHPVPEPGPGELLIRIARGGICGSDLHYYQDGGFGTVRVREPMILGHEVSGRIAALGSGVTGFTESQLVAVSPSRPDWNDDYARRGMPHHSLGMRFYGSAMPMPHIQGAFADYVVATPDQCVDATGLTPEQAAMAEPLSVVLHALKQADQLLGARVLVTGCGPIGVLAVLALRRAGAAEIVATDIADASLTHAMAAGADQAINTLAKPDALTPRLDHKGSFDVQIECSGAPAALHQGIGLVRPRGVIVQVGIGGNVEVPMNTIVAKELQVRGSFRFHFEFAEAVELMRKQLIDVRPLVTHHFAADDAVTAFETAGDRSKAMKVQLDFDRD